MTTSVGPRLTKANREEIFVAIREAVEFAREHPLTAGGITQGYKLLHWPVVVEWFRTHKKWDIIQSTAESWYRRSLASQGKNPSGPFTRNVNGFSGVVYVNFPRIMDKVITTYAGKDPWGAIARLFADEFGMFGRPSMISLERSIQNIAHDNKELDSQRLLREGIRLPVIRGTTEKMCQLGRDAVGALLFKIVTQVAADQIPGSPWAEVQTRFTKETGAVCTKACLRAATCAYLTQHHPEVSTRFFKKDKQENRDWLNEEFDNTDTRIDEESKELIKKLQYRIAPCLRGILDQLDKLQERLDEFQGESSTLKDAVAGVVGKIFGEEVHLPEKEN